MAHCVGNKGGNHKWSLLYTIELILERQVLQIVHVHGADAAALVGRRAGSSTLEEVHVPRKGLAVQLLLERQSRRDVPVVHHGLAVLRLDLLLVQEALPVLAVHPHHRHAQQVPRDVVVVHLVRELRAERVRHEAVLRHADLPAAEPRAQRDLDVLAAPAAHALVHGTLAPPLLARRKHAHRDGRVVVAARAAAPHDAQGPGKGGGARREGRTESRPADAVVMRHGNEGVRVEFEVHEVHQRLRVLHVGAA